MPCTTKRDEIHVGRAAEPLGPVRRDGDEGWRDLNTAAA